MEGRERIGGDRRRTESHRAPSAPAPFPRSTDRVLALQRHAGNAAVARVATAHAGGARRIQRVVHPEYKGHWTDGLELGLLTPAHVRTARETVGALTADDRKDTEVRAFVTDPPEKGALKGLRRLVSGPKQTDHSARAWRALTDAGFELAAARATLEADPPRVLPSESKRRELTQAYAAALRARFGLTPKTAEAFDRFWATADPKLRWSVLVRVLPEVAGVGLKPMTSLFYVLESVDPKRRHNSFWELAGGGRGVLREWLEDAQPGESLFDYADRHAESRTAGTTEREDKTGRSRFRMSFPGGVMSDAAGAVADGEYLFVVDEGQRFYAAPGKSGDISRHHSSFLGGRGVRSAGSLEVERGRIKLLSDQSGHYKPTKHEVLLALQTLQRLGANLASFAVSLHGEPKPVPAHMYLLAETSAPGRRHRPSRMHSNAGAPEPGLQVLTGLSAVGW